MRMSGSGGTVMDPGWHGRAVVKPFIQEIHTKTTGGVFFRALVLLFLIQCGGYEAGMKGFQLCGISQDMSCCAAAGGSERLLYCMWRE